ncbi:hypothetical protein ACET9H_18965 [Aeromonas media]|uniref:hypothetical protein n=1 Tax=Aeromonas media TaxID=651 RepID=UPI00126A76EC|nr:hypothetical protein [Aeromonas media]
MMRIILFSKIRVVGRFITIAFLVTMTSFSISSKAIASSSLDEIVTPNMIGVTLKYAEYKIGVPAMKEKIDDLGFQRNSYELNGCYIYMGIKNGEVVSIGMSFQPEIGCDVNVSGVMYQPSGFIKGSSTTFKDYAWRGQLHFTDPQIPTCNACWEGMFYATIDGSSASNYISLKLTAYGGPESNHRAWKDMLENNGLNYEELDRLPLAAENCPLRRFDVQAFGLLKDTKVTGIEYGRSNVDPQPLQPQCSGKTVHSLMLRSN